MDKAIRGIRLIEQLEAVHAFEAGLIDRSDWDRFDCEQLLRVANGDVTLDAIVGWRDHVAKRSDDERLAEWNRRASNQ